MRAFTSINKILIDSATIIIHQGTIGTIDSTIADNTPPTFTIASGPAAGTTVTTNPAAYEFTITDKSGIDSVYWTLNGTRQTYLTPGSIGRYALSAPLTSPPHSNRITVHAWDKSANHNRDSVVIAINYDQKPKTVSRTDLTTPRAIALACTLTATDPEGDALSSWTMLSGWPRHGTVTSTTPVFIYTPTATYEGKDTILFTVSDGTLKSDTGTLVVSMATNNVAPVIKTQPVSVSVDQGKNATFTATINTDVYPQPNYIRWVHNNTDTVAGQTTLTCTISAAQYKDSGTYKVVVRNSASTAESDNAAKLTVKDKTPPVLTLKGAADTIIVLGSVWTDPRGTVNDDKDGTIQPNAIVITSMVNKDAVGVNVLTYNVSDAAGNAAVSKQRTVRVEGWVKVDEFAGELHRIVLTSDDVLYIPFINNTTDYVRKIPSTGAPTTLSIPSSCGANLSATIGNDNKTLYTSSSCGGRFIEKYDGSNWSEPAPVPPLIYSAFVSLIIGPSNTPYIGGNFDDVYKNQVRKYTNGDWQFVGASDFQLPMALSGQGPDGSYFCVTSPGDVPYTIYKTDDSSTIQSWRYTGGSWSGVNIVGPGSKYDYDNMHIVASGSSVAAGFTQDYIGTNPAIYLLNGTSSWTALPSMAKNPAQAGGGFSMSYSTGGVLYAAHPEGTVIAVASYNANKWESVPSVGDRAAFSAPNCESVSISASADMCCVAYYDSNTGKIVVMQWSKQ